MTRYIFITGGVVSSLGKGVVSSSLAALLQAHGYTVGLKKLDPYLNVDPGTMSPTQHGEVYVTADGAETDLDLGHYERFTGITTDRHSNITSGQIYATILEKERRGDFLGKTVQVVPHVTNEIKAFIQDSNSQSVDFLLCEIGGTVGDIEGQPFLEAIRQFSLEVGKTQTAFLHLTLLPYLKSAQEIKTKPTQYSVKELLSLGIQPDILICRHEVPVDLATLNKIASFCNVDKDCVISAPDVDNIYAVVTKYHENNLDRAVLKHFGLDREKEPDLRIWQEIQHNIISATTKVKIGIVGKYTGYNDSYKSLIEAIKDASYYQHYAPEIIWINAREVNSEADLQMLNEVDGLIIPGGFGEEGIEGKILALKLAREHKIPTLGICLGMQLMAIEFARNILHLSQANSTEFQPDTPEPVVHLINRQLLAEGKIEALGGTMRLGAHACKIIPHTLAANIYGTELIHERHRHRYTINTTAYKSAFTEQGLLFSGEAPNTDQFTEIIELSQHPFFIGVQFHPEFMSRPFAPSPLFLALIAAAKR